MITFQNFTTDELKNSVLVLIDAFEHDQSQSIDEDKRVTDTFISKEMDVDIISLQSILKLLKEESKIDFEEKDSLIYKIHCLDEATKIFDAFKNMKLSDLATKILMKSYEWYKRQNYQLDSQQDSYILCCSLGINNLEKTWNALDLLDSKKLIKKWVKTRCIYRFGITLEGVNFMENPPTPKQTIAPVVNITGNSGNVSINSNNVSQNIANNINQLEELFGIIEKSIKENVTSTEQQNMLDDLETARELTKSENPNSRLITRIMTRLGAALPIVLDSIQKVIELIQSVHG